MMGSNRPLLKIREELTHLSAAQIDELSARYEAGEKCAQLIIDYNIKTTPNKLSKILPLCIVSNLTCPHCKEPMYREVRRKNTHYYNQPYATCIECQHIEYADKDNNRNELCICTQCNNLRNHEAEIKATMSRAIISEKYSTNSYPAYPYSQLSFSEKLFILAFIEAGHIDTEQTFHPLSKTSNSKPFMPSRSMGVECLTSLFHRKILLVNPDTPTCFFHELNNFNTFDFESVSWIVNVTLDTIKKANLTVLRDQIVQDVIYSRIRPEWSIDIHDLIFKIATEEAIMNISVAIEKHDQLTEPPSASTRKSIIAMLNDFSVSEIRHLSKLAIDNAIEFYNSGLSKGRKHATNSIPGEMLKKAERAKIKSWSISNPPRNPALPRSALSIILYEQILNAKDAGFYKPLTPYWEEDIKKKYFTVHAPNLLHCTACNSHEIIPVMTGNNIHIACKECGELKFFSEC